MRNILIISLLFVSCFAFGQIPASNIALDPNKSKDDPYFLLSDTSGVYRGRAQFHTKAYVSGLLEPYLGCIDTAFVRNDSLFIYTTDRDSIEFAGGGGGADLTLMRLVNSSNSATHTILLTNDNSPQGSVRLTEGGGVTFATTGTSDDAIVTFSTSGLLHTTDTASMLTHYIERGDTSGMLGHYIERGDTAVMLDPYTPNWTDAGNYIYPAENDTVYIPSYSSGTGVLNVYGRIDTRFPSSSGTNIAIGQRAANTSLSGSSNIAIGNYSLRSVTSTTSPNIAIGDSSMYSTTSTSLSNIAIGHAALKNGVSTSSMIAIGNNALRDATSVVGRDIAIGNSAGKLITSGVSNVLIGASSGSSLTTGNNNIFIGSNSGLNETGSSKLYIEPSSSSTPLIGGDFVADSIHIHGKLGYFTNGSTPTKIAGRSGTQFSDITLGSDLSLTSGTLSTNLSGIYQPLDADLTYLAGVTLSANVKTLLNAADYSAFKTSLSLNNVTNESKATMFTSPTFTGTAVIPTPYTIGAVSMTSTGTQLNYLNAATGTTGTTSTNLVFSTSPTLVTPILGTPTSGTLTNCTGYPFTSLSGDLQLSENTPIKLDAAGSADGKYSGTTILGTGGATIAFGDLVTLDKDDSRWELVDISVAAAATGDARGIFGIAVTSSTDGTAITVLLNGTVRADANFPTLTIGAAVYASTTGDVVVTQPSTTDYVIRVIGFALTADEIYFNPSNDWITHI